MRSWQTKFSQPRCDWTLGLSQPDQKYFFVWSYSPRICRPWWRLRRWDWFVWKCGEIPNQRIAFITFLKSQQIVVVDLWRQRCLWHKFSSHVNDPLQRESFHFCIITESKWKEFWCEMRQSNHVLLLEDVKAANKQFQKQRTCFILRMLRDRAQLLSSKKSLKQANGCMVTKFSCSTNVEVYTLLITSSNIV